MPGREAARDHLLFFGLIRPYKGLDGLIEAYGRVRGTFGLKVCGPVWPGASEYAERISAFGKSQPGVTIDLRRLSEEELDAAIEDSAGVVLPYAGMLNSGALLKALSGQRPVLVPRGNVTVELAEELGSQWVVLYEPPLQAADLDEFWKHMSSEGGPRGGPDFSLRGWSSIGLSHKEAYEAACRVGGSARM
jgi:glycosyltransferase involved in cell wall biosynthesis